MAFLGDESRAPPVMGTIGMRIVEFDEGTAAVSMRAGRRFHNPMGRLHGGVMTDLADACMGIATMTTLGEGESFTTLELKMNFLRPVYEGELTARATVVHRGKTVAMTEVVVKNQHGKEVARGAATQMVLRAEERADSTPRSRDRLASLRPMRASGLSFRVIRARQGDLALLVEHRLRMWHDIHPEFGTRIEKSRPYTRRWINEKLSAGELIGFIARAPDGTVAGSGCVWLREEAPRPGDSLHVVPYLMSMYTEERFRRQGVARRVLEQALKWTKDHRHGRMVLHASDDGRRLYEAFGFGPTGEMRLAL